MSKLAKLARSTLVGGEGFIGEGGAVWEKEDGVVTVLVLVVHLL